ncbi:hypothetical protein DL96DRAFT_268024 [Flagelloscypha sp. PMI_526]|nr:hypothetical protein DL96DRAFT_268024 [Flagelloscypha sp. PMI_526]
MSVHLADIPGSPPLEPDWDKDEIPSPNDLYAIRRSINTSRDALSQTLVLQSRLQTLKTRIQSTERLHRDNISRQLPRLWHANIIPHDIWREIFIWVVLILPDAPFSQFPTASTTLTLTHICRDWRDIASKTPFLWSKIVIQSGIHVTLGTINLLTLFFTCSIHIPLTFIADLSKDQDTRSPKDGSKLRQAVDMAMSQSFRWQHLELVLPFSLWNSNTISFPIHAPLLEEAFISCEYSSNPRSSAWTQSVFTESSAPRLRRIRLQHLTTGPHGFKDFLPWSRLDTVIILTPSNYQWRFGRAEVYTVLQSCPHLSTSHLIFSREGEPPAGHVTAPFLHTLHHWSLDAKVLEHLTAPNLSELKLVQAPLSEAEIISSFITRSPLLKSLVLSGTGTSIGFLSLAPHMSLERISIQIHGNAGMLELADILRSLHVSPQATLPGLQTLVVTLNCEKLIDNNSATLRVFTAIVNVVKSRTHASSKLQRVEIFIKDYTSAPETSRTVLRQLQLLELDGLHVSLR